MPPQKNGHRGHLCLKKRVGVVRAAGKNRDPPPATGTWIEPRASHRSAPGRAQRFEDPECERIGAARKIDSTVSRNSENSRASAPLAINKPPQPPIATLQQINRHLLPRRAKKGFVTRINNSWLSRGTGDTQSRSLPREPSVVRGNFQGGKKVPTPGPGDPGFRDCPRNRPKVIRPNFHVFPWGRQPRT